MRKTAFLIVVSLLFLPPRSTAGSADPVESLIEEHQDEEQDATNEELPVLFLFGDKTGVEIYSASAYGGQSNLLCEPVQLDEMIELSRGRPEDFQTVLNMSLPRVHEAMNQTCLIRPGDYVLAVGRGWQKYMRVKDFVVRRDKISCPLDSPHSLWVHFEQDLEEPPLFYSTTSELRESLNEFKRLEELPVVSLSNGAKKQLQDHLTVLKEYETVVYSVDALNCSRLIVARRRTVSPDDDNLTNEAVFWEGRDRVEKLWEEKVSLHRGSGHIRIEGLLDYNGDGRIDLFLTGDHGQCPYRALFEGRETGFEAVDVPNKPCGC